MSVELNKKSSISYHHIAFLNTKTHIPSSKGSIIKRGELFRKLDMSIHKKLTLVTAPVGFGKTAAVSAWAEQNRGKHAIAWVSLNKSDDEEVSFWGYFVYGVYNIINEDICEITSLTNTKEPFSYKCILNILINSLSKADSEIFIILDNFHVIKDADIYKGMEYFIDYMPDNVHLIIMSRIRPSFPISILRMKEMLLEINSQDLRFSCDEIAEFFIAQPNLRLDPLQLKEIEDKTEGWIAAIKIAALSLQEHSENEEYLKVFTWENHRMRMLIHEEILEKLPKEVRDFLYQTSILSSLSSKTCNVVVGIKNSQQILEYLFDNHIFIHSQDNNIANFKYNPLFAAFLRSRLNDNYPGLAETLHLKASQWYEANGCIDEAIEHSISSQSYENTTRLVEMYVNGYMNLGQYQNVITLVDKMPLHFIHKAPRICISYALSKALVWQLYREDTALLSKGIYLDSEAFKEYKFELAVIRAAIALNVEDIRAEEVIKHLNTALRLKVPLSMLHAEAFLKFGYICMIKGDFISADKYYTKALTVAKKFNSVNIILNSMHTLGQIKFNNGFVTNALEFYKSAIEMIEKDHGFSYPAANTVFLSAAYAYYELNNLELANKYINKGIELSEAIQDNYGLLMGNVFKAMTQAAEKKHKDAIDTIIAVDKHCSKPEYRFVMTQVISHLVSIYIKVGNVEMAEELVYKYKIIIHDQIKYIYEEEHIGLIKLYIALGKGERILPLIEQMLAEAKASRRTLSIIKILAAKAVVYKQSDKVDMAIKLIKEALQITYRVGYQRTYIDYGKYMRALLLDYVEHESNSKIMDDKLVCYGFKLLSYFTDETGQELHKNHFLNQMKPRELEIIKYIYIGYSNQEISEKMYISVSSVKKYINNIYEKMCVKNRAQAIAAIRQFDIVI